MHRPKEWRENMGKAVIAEGERDREWWFESKLGMVRAHAVPCISISQNPVIATFDGQLASFFDDGRFGRSGLGWPAEFDDDHAFPPLTLIHFCPHTT